MRIACSSLVSIATLVLQIPAQSAGPRIAPVPERDMARQAGLTNDDLRRIAQGPEAAGWDGFEATLLRATDELYRDDRVSDDTWAVLARALDTKQRLDVLIAVGGYRAPSMAINSAGVQLDANMADFRFPAALR